MSQYSVEAILKATGAEQFAKAFENSARSLEGLEANVNKSSGGLKNMMGSIGKIAAGIGVTKLVAAGFNAIKNSIGDAVSRVDTLNQFPRMMEAMGFSADESKGSIDKLSKGIQGLPTTLDSVAATAQKLAILTGDLDGATETTLALNNAFLASGSSSADASRGLNQYTQMLSKGEVDMQSWRTLQETMGVALNDTAKAFGFAGESAQNDLYAALKDGTITFDQFNEKIIELDQGVGGFAERALIGSAGIATSMQNIKTAITTGVANSIQAVNDAMEAGGFGSISENLDKVKVAVQGAFSGMVANIGPAVQAFGEFYTKVRESTAFQSFIELAGLVIGKFVELKNSFMQSQFVADLKQKFSELVSAMSQIDFVKLAQDAMQLIEKWAPLIAGVMGAFVAFKTITTAISVYQKTMGLVTTAVKVGGAAIGFLTSPIGIAIVAIGAIIAIGVALYRNWDTVKATANSLKNGLVNAWNTIKSKTTSVFNSVKTTITSAFSGINLFSAGKAIIDGFVRGLKATWEAGKSFVKGIGTWIKNNKGPISYDRKLLKPAGNAIIGGLNKGLQDSFLDVQKTIGGMAGEISQTMFGGPTIDVSGSIARSNAAINGQVTHSINNGTPGRSINVTQYITSPNALSEREMQRRSRLELQKLGVDFAY